MELKDINKSISDMTDDDIRALLTSIRSSRRTSKKPPTAAKKSASVTKSEVDTNTLLNSISAKDAEILLKMLGGSK